MSERQLKVFLCHSSGDKPSVRDLYVRLLSAADYIAPWLDEENLLPGQRWEEEIPKAVRNSDIVLVCLSKDSIQKTGYVQKEIKVALDVADTQPEGTIYIIPVKLEECQIPNRLSHLQYVNLYEGKGFDRLMRALLSGAKKLSIGKLTPTKRTDKTTSDPTAPSSSYENWKLTIRVRYVEDVVILDMEGRMTIGEGSVVLRNTIRSLLHEERKNILLNLAGVTYVDNSGVGELVSSFTVVRGTGGQFKFLNLPEKIRALFRIVKLLDIFESFTDEADALDSFRK